MTTSIDVGGERGTYAGADGRTLHYRRVPSPSPRHRIVYLHGIESHGGWFLPTAETLAARGIESVLVDRRGSGLDRTDPPLRVASAAQLLEDVHRARALVDADTAHLVGLSWGGKLALAAALDRPDDWSSLTLITPGLVPRVTLPPLGKLRLLCSWLLAPGAAFEVPIRPPMFTTTPHWLRAIREDPLRASVVSASFLRASVALDRAVRRGVASLRPPTLLLLAEHDEIIDNAGTLDLLGRAPRCTAHTFPGASHSIQFDQTEELADRLATFLEEQHP